MRKRGSLRRLLIIAPAGGLLMMGGCLAALERGVDLVLSPGALANTLVAPYDPLMSLIGVFARSGLG